MADEEPTDEEQVGHDEARAEADAQQEIQRVEEDPPDKLEDWPGGKAKYKTMGGPDGEADYHDGPTSQLGPTDLQYHEDGSVTIEGEEVDDPDQYKGDPIPGGPTDPDAPPDPA